MALRRVPAASLGQCSGHPCPLPSFQWLPSSCLCSAILCWCLSDRLTRHLDPEAHFRHFSCRQYICFRRRRAFPALVYNALPWTTPADSSCRDRPGSYFNSSSRTRNTSQWSALECLQTYRLTALRPTSCDCIGFRDPSALGRRHDA